MADPIMHALEQALCSEISHVFCTTSRDIKHRGGHEAAARTVVETIENLQKFYNEVIDQLNEENGVP